VSAFPEEPDVLLLTGPEAQQIAVPVLLGSRAALRPGDAVWLTVRPEAPRRRAR